MYQRQTKADLLKVPTQPTTARQPVLVQRTGAHRPPAWTAALGIYSTAALFGPQTGIQTKLTVNQPGDMYEQQADHVAAQVMRMPEPRVQRRCACGGEAGPDGECEACKARRLGIQRKAESAGRMEVPPSVHQTLRSPGQPLDTATRAFLEPRIGHDFSGVRVHTDVQAAQSAADVSAQAYTVGQNVVFGAGRYAPGTSSGNTLIAHELAHVVQQGHLSAFSVLQRQCENDENHFQSAPNFCLDTSFSPSTHPGKRCYREIVPRSGWFSCPPGAHVCFDSEGHCESSPDKASLAGDRKADGSCSWRWWCIGAHTLADFVPSVLQLDCMEACRNVPDPRCMIQCVNSKH
jgi:hypothetical protein